MGRNGRRNSSAWRTSGLGSAFPNRSGRSSPAASVTESFDVDDRRTHGEANSNEEDNHASNVEEERSSRSAGQATYPPSEPETVAVDSNH